MGSVFYESMEKKAFFYEDRDIAFPAHLHKQIEVFYLIEGTVRLSLDHKTRLMHAGDVLLVFPNQIHSYESLDHTRFFIGLADPEVLGKNGAVFLKNICINPVNPVTMFSENLLGCMNAAASENRKGRINGRECRLYGYFTVIADYLLEKVELKPLEAGGEDLMYSAFQYVLNHYKEDISLDLAAHETGISKCYLSRMFSGKIGYPFSTYITVLRTEYAKELLEVTDKGMNEIACRCGFKSESSFFRNFKRVTGMTPLGYRKYKRQKGGEGNR